MKLGIDNRCALVVGGSRGIGRAIAETLADEGVAVGVMARNRVQLGEVVERIQQGGGRAIALAGDVGIAEHRVGAVARLQDAFGPPTILILSNAMMFTHQKLHTMSDADISAQLDVDLCSTLLLLRDVIPHMMRSKFGRIVLLGSLTAKTGFKGSAVYGAIKASYSGLVRGLAVDYGRYGITANVVSPASVLTERLQERLHENAEMLEQHVRSTSMRKLLDVRAIAQSVVHLCGEHAWGHNGSTIEIHNGQDLYGGQAK